MGMVMGLAWPTPCVLADSCPPAWTPGFGLLGVDADVNAITVFDDGTGPALYAGGAFTAAGGVLANRIAKWNGTQWSALGSGLTGGSSPYVSALAVFDDGTGPALYAGGEFTTAGGVPANRIATSGMARSGRPWAVG
ncbi:MAG: hypothetical protein V2A79_16685 [Planctomycetota bacterium]